MKTHAAAVLNAAEYDRRKGGQTMPADTKAVWPKREPHWKAYNPKYIKERPPVMNDAEKHQGRQVIIAGQEYGFNLCREIWFQHRDRGKEVYVLAKEYDLPKMVIHSILQKGIHGKLTIKNVKS